MKKLFATLFLALVSSSAVAQTPLPTLNPLDYGAASCGSADCTGPFQAAVNAVPAAGGRVIVPLNPAGGMWNLVPTSGWANRVTIARSNLTLECAPGVALSGGILGLGAQIAATNLAAPPAYLDVAFNVASTAGATVGGYVEVDGNMPGGVGYYSIMTRIIGVSSPTVVIAHPFPLNVAGATAGNVRFLAPLENLRVKGCTFDGAALGSAAVYNAVDLQLVARSSVEGVRATNFNGACVTFYMGLDNQATDLDVEGCGGVLSQQAQIAAMSFDRQTGLVARGLRATRSAGIGVQFGSSTYWTAQDVMSAYSWIVAPSGAGSGRGIKLNSSIHGSLTDYRAMFNGATGVAIANGSMNNVLTNGHVLRNENFASGALSDGNGLWLDGNNNTGNVIVGLTSHVSQLFDIALGIGDLGNVFRSLVTDAKYSPVGLSGNTLDP